MPIPKHARFDVVEHAAGDTQPVRERRTATMSRQSECKRRTACQRSQPGVAVVHEYMAISDDTALKEHYRGQGVLHC